MTLPDWLKPEINVNAPQKKGAPWWIQTRDAIDGIQKRTRFKNYLLVEQNATELFPNSNKNLPRIHEHDEYIKHLAPYQHIIESDKTEFLDHDAAIGHKVHLNVSPDNVRRVSQYLIDHRYAHKFLSGGEAEDGTIFTIYFGSRLKAMQWSSKLASELHQYLQSPIRRDELEYAPNISGRFVGSRKDYSQYPCARTRGISSISDLIKGDLWTERNPEESEKHKMEVFSKSFERLADQYGTFFYG